MSTATGNGIYLLGLHHVTAVSSKINENVRFYTEALGMRLVKKSVNQDDTSAYHLFYGDEIGRAGTEVTFFDWPHISANRPGAGTISGIGLRVPSVSALEAPTVEFTDREGLRLQLVDDGGASGGGIPWHKSPVPGEIGIRGLATVSLTVAKLEPTRAFITDVMHFRVVAEHEEEGKRVVLFETGAGGPGAWVRVVEDRSASRGTVGHGGTHHVAFHAPTLDALTKWHGYMESLRVPNSGLVDRYYFESLYFREPSGVLFEVAADKAGFVGDEDADHLGEKLSLPPFMEPRRATIEANLKPLAFPANPF
jgi:glyoxalase family protein